jgi:hypothetical protein
MTSPLSAQQSVQRSQILNLLSDGRISVTQAERLLAAANARPLLWEWLPTLAVLAALALQHMAALHLALQWMALRAAELATSDYLHITINH